MLVSFSWERYPDSFVHFITWTIRALAVIIRVWKERTLRPRRIGGFQLRISFKIWLLATCQISLIITSQFKSAYFNTRMLFFPFQVFSLDLLQNVFTENLVTWCPCKMWVSYSMKSVWNSDFFFFLRLFVLPVWVVFVEFLYIFILF